MSASKRPNAKEIKVSGMVKDIPACKIGKRNH